ncbi:MAG: hypothetical protein EOM23_09500 [Candidatus Moranbacteria bacterium]|nr:hypothetical protein [Candidatus Moranbacteria bacterium]
MYKSIDSVKRAARKNGKVVLNGLNDRDRVKLLKQAGFPTAAGTIYIPGYDGKNQYLTYKKEI